jgi:uncharacterized protein
VTLDRLPPAHRTAFAAACAERLLPNYAAFAAETGWGDTRRLRAALDAVWRHLGDPGGVAASELRAHYAAVDEAIPDTEDFDTPLVSFALDAGVAVLSATAACYDPDPAHAASASEAATDTLDMFIQESLDLDASGPELEAVIAAHPLMQRERARQAEDLQTLADASVLTADVLEALRARSWNGGVGNVGL